MARLPASSSTLHRLVACAAIALATLLPAPAPAAPGPGDAAAPRPTAAAPAPHLVPVSRAGSTVPRAREPISRGYRAWRPRWWPAWLPAGTGKAGVLVSIKYNRVYAHDGRHGWRHFPAATGKGYATPRGRYSIVNKVLKPAWTYKDKHVPGGTYGNPLGAAWLGLGMPPGWGRYPVGIHGTNAPWSIGFRVSKGCIRLQNRDIMRLYRMVPVGTPVWIVW
jgi:lipoprotein-anchoring transpeptidase ErfK/SrfK